MGGLLVSIEFFLSTYTTSLNYLFICFAAIGGHIVQALQETIRVVKSGTLVRPRV